MALTTSCVIPPPERDLCIQGAQLAGQMREDAERFGLEVLPAHSVTSIGTRGNFKVVNTESGDAYCSDAVLVAT